MSQFFCSVFVTPEFFSSDNLYSNNTGNNSAYLVNKKNNFEIGDYSNIFLNETLKSEILNFLKRSQDSAVNLFSSMDDAYYIGKSLVLLNYFINDTILETNNIIQSIIDFIAESRNMDGGYGNWKGGRSSMESTFQAIDLIHSLNLSLPFDDAKKTDEFIDSLKTSSFGYFPLPEWDAPDISSSYRAIYLKNIFINWFPNDFTSIDENDTLTYIKGNFIEPIFLHGASGYSEISNGSIELLATAYAMNSIEIMKGTEFHTLEIAKFLSSLTSFNGGISGALTGTPKTGFTSTGLELFLLLNQSNYYLSEYSYYFSNDYINKSINYIKTTKKPASGFSASERDISAELSSTYFVLDLLVNLHKKNIPIPEIDLTGVKAFLISGKEPTFGLGNYPGDVPNIQYTTETILISRMLSKYDWLLSNGSGIKNFLQETYDNSGGFGFRPNSQPFVKYTYYGVFGLRAILDSLPTSDHIKNFLFSTETPMGGFGSIPGAQLSYLTHTFWAINTLDLIGELNNPLNDLNISKLFSFLSSLKNSDHFYSNYPFQQSSMASTYRALYLYTLFNNNSFISERDNLIMTLEKYNTPSGGFVSALDKSVPDIISTYYAVIIAELLGYQLNNTLIKEFVFSLLNEDGGFGLRPKFSSRITSTYYSLLILNFLESKNLNLTSSFKELSIDYLSPLIKPGFVPFLETNKTIQNIYRTTAKISDPEGITSKAWLEIEWTLMNESNKVFVIYSNITGNKNFIDQEIFEFFIKQTDYNQNGLLKFRFKAVDNNNNVASSELFTLLTSKITTKNNNLEVNWLTIFLNSIIPIFLIFGSIEGVKNTLSNKKISNLDVKMEIQLKKSKKGPRRSSFSLFFIFLFISMVALISRLFLTHALPILENSKFLFQFMLGALIVLFFNYVLGLDSFGFFSPMIIVISWLKLGPFWGLAIFFTIFACGYTIRQFLSEYNLASGFRIGLTMIFIIALMGLLEILGETFRIDFLSSSILLPIIIVPSFIDQYTIESEEHSHLDASKRLFFTLIITFVAYIFMSYDPLVLFIVTNPETWVLLFGIAFLIGKSRKFTRFDKKRFKSLYNKKEDPLTLMVRNRDYISKYNEKVLFPIINKMNLKDQFELWHVPSPELLGIINNERDLSNLMNRIQNETQFANGFVIKPSNSFGGRGILVVSKRTESEKNFIIGSEVYHVKALEKHIQNILQGEFLTSQIGSSSDIVIIEELIVCNENLQNISVGLPDIRVIVFKGIPIMAMARLPTQESGGKANLKQGAIGTGIRMNDGHFFKAQFKGYEVEKHPDTNNPLIGFQFEEQIWLDILTIASLSQKATGLGYAGVDLVVDKNNRVLVLEVNKRPGLEIQNINGSSILKRIQLVEELGIDAMDLSPSKSAMIGLDLANKYWRNGINEF